ncbi:ATP-dependent DNA helicase [Leifsonia xyli subsp. cynodontis DSM 46306]|uniref:DNA 3'-5' helicase n=1 Tax=Leifsonia xyli subsp. cynodontis DSM 46306 TaxID=1389489 RepID=U3P3Y3_LEIXC|nr:ATP-dependent DNA helicase [Leifsonia xyli]AGW41020.1 ATP-dependent DNA helicase [Leifsonia xyli subsp. cynodontis DSM 46306]
MTTLGFRARETARVAAAVLSLDPAQREVAALPDGASAAVLGAPGTGKTTALVEALAERVLGRGYAPGEVLALSASRAAATALRDRLALRLGVPTPGPLARTATSLAFQLAGERARRTGEEPPRLLTGGEQDQIIAELLAGQLGDGTGPLWPDALGPEVRSLRGFRTELRELIARCAERGVSPARLSELGAIAGREGWRAAAAFIAEYQSVLDSYRGGFVDAAELIASAVAIVRDGSPLDSLRAVFVDDLQEVTVATIALLRALASRGVAVIAFGDPDVASTAFRGAEATALGQLGARLGVPVTRFVLATAHRQTPVLRELTARVTERIGTAAAGVQRVASAGRGEPERTGGNRPEVVVVQAVSAPSEAARLARRLRERRLLDGVPWGEMAVVVRSGAHIPGLARALAVAEVPTKTSIAGRALRDGFAARQLITLAGVEVGAVDLTSETATELLLGPFGGLDGISLRRLRLALRQEELAGDGNRAADELLVEALADPARLATIDSSPARRAARLAETLRSGREKAAAGSTIEELLWHAWERSGLARRWLEQSERSGIVADEANRHLDGVVALFTAARRFVERFPERPASDFVVELLGAEVPEDTLAAQTAGDAVLVCTPSATVGREFEVVAVARLQESVWPNLRLRGSLLHPQEIDSVLDGRETETEDQRAQVLGDELRMFALAVSRARGQVLLTATANDDEQPSPLLRLAGELAAPDMEDSIHPLSLRGMVGRLRRRLVTTGAPEAADALARLADAGVEGADPADWYGLVEPTTEEPLVDLTDPEAGVRLSPSRLGTFEKSPLAWFVEEMAASPSSLTAGIGTVVHAVMEEASATGEFGVDALWAGIERRWAELAFESPWVEERERRRTRGLVGGVSGYLRDFERAGGRLLGSEGEFELRLGRARIGGKIDRVEATPDGTVVVVDLKTGRTVPSPAEAASHAQLGAYQLALEHGAIEQAGERPPGGAKLLFVAKGVRGKPYREVVQDRVDAEGLERLKQRVAVAAEGMAAATFAAVVDLDDRDPHAAYEYRLHLVPAVSA